jgi:hypothetical protein
MECKTIDKLANNEIKYWAFPGLRPGRFSFTLRVRLRALWAHFVRGLRTSLCFGSWLGPKGLGTACHYGPTGRSQAVLRLAHQSVAPNAFVRNAVVENCQWCVRKIRYYCTRQF